jgi:hypothetical protein
MVEKKFGLPWQIVAVPVPHKSAIPGREEVAQLAIEGASAALFMNIKNATSTREV